MRKLIFVICALHSVLASEFRLSKQFKETLMNSGEESPSEANIAMSLVDALQNWADALEAQISMMRSEVMDLKNSNRELSGEVSTLRKENEMLKSSFEEVESELTGIQGETTGIKDDLRVMSTSFAEFLDHFNLHSQTVWANHSSLHDSLKNLTNSHELSTMRVSIESLSESFTSLKEEVKTNENRLVQVLADSKALEANLQLILYNASIALFSEVEGLRKQDEAFVGDFQNVQKSLEFIQSKYELISNETGYMKTQVIASLELIQIEMQANQEATQATMQPMITSLNDTLYNSIGTLQSNVSSLKMAQEESRQDILRLDSMVASYAVTQDLQSNVSISMQEQLIGLSSFVNDLQGRLSDQETSVYNLSEVASYNSTLLQRGFFSLERHFIEMKRKLFETQTQVEYVNASVQIIGDLRTEVIAIGRAMANTTSLISSRFEDVSTTTATLQQNLDFAWNASLNLDQRVTKLEKNHTLVAGILKSSVDEVFAKHNAIEVTVGKAANRTQMLESGLAGLMNYSLELDDYLTVLRENVTLLNSSLARADLRIDKAYELYELQGARVAENANVIKDNVTKLSLAANILEAELSRVASGYTSLKNALSRYVSSAGNIEVNVQKLVTESIYVKSELDAMRYEMASVKAEASGVSVFVTTLQNHVGGLTSNVTQLTKNVTDMAQSMGNILGHMAEIDSGIDSIGKNMSDVKNSIQNNTEHMEEIDGNMGTLKSNVLGLGDYINSINSDLGSVLTSFDAYAKRVSADIGYVKSNMSEMLMDIQITGNKSEELWKRFDSVEYSSNSLKSDVTDLTTKMYTIKTAVFEFNNEVDILKTSQSGLNKNMEGLLSELDKMQSTKSVQEVALSALKADMTALKTGMSAISATMLELKAHTPSMKDMDTQMAALKSNVTSLNLQFTTFKQTFADMDVFHTELTRYKQSVNSLSTKMALISDPARFSCAVTTDEIRVPGVVTYSTCNVNSAAMMNKNTGHISVRDPGDYFLTFTANMVSVNSQAIWCAIYKQSPGSDGWQVLGMINNYQRDAGDEDDRDSGTISLIASLKEGDQVWVEWRGYGDSFLYSNPYRLITFSGFLVNSAVVQQDDDSRLIS